MVNHYEDESRNLGDFTDYEDYDGPDQVSALLTKKQREYLEGNSDIEPKSPQERSIRARIRERLTQTIDDLSLVGNSLESRDIEKSFATPDLFNSMSSVFALIFDGTSRASKYEDPSVEGGVPNDDTIEMFESFIQGGIECLYTSRGLEIKDIDVSIDIEFGRKAEEIAEGGLDGVSVEEMLLLVRSGEISEETAFSVLNQRKGWEIARHGDAFLIQSSPDGLQEDSEE